MKQMYGWVPEKPPGPFWIYQADPQTSLFDGCQLEKLPEVEPDLAFLAFLMWAPLEDEQEARPNVNKAARAKRIVFFMTVGFKGFSCVCLLEQI